MTSTGGPNAKCGGPSCPGGYGTGYEILTSGTCKFEVTSQEECFMAHKWLGSSDDENGTDRRRLFDAGSSPINGCVRYAWGGASYSLKTNLASHRDQECGKDGQNCICRTYKCSKCPDGTIGVGGTEPCKGGPNPFYSTVDGPSSGSGPASGSGSSGGAGGQQFSASGEAGWILGPTGPVRSAPAGSKPFVWYANSKVVNCQPGYERKVPPYIYGQHHDTPFCSPCNSGYFSAGGVNPTCSVCPVGTVSGVGSSECVNLKAELAALKNMMTNPRKYLCEAATDFCGPGTKWIDGNCVSSYDGMKEACIKARPGWEWTCETSKVCEDKN